MKRTILTLFAATSLAVGFAPDAFAQSARKRQEPAAPAQADPKAKERGMAEAPAVVAAANAACTVTDAVWRGQTTAADNTKAEVYEVVCQEGLGYVLSKAPSGVATSSDCLAVASSAARPGADGKPVGGATCELPGNADPKAGLQPLLAASLNCTVKDATWLGYSATGKLNRYEVACEQGPGFIVDRKEDRTVATRACLESASACTLTTRAQNALALAPAVAKTGRACAISDARAVGSSTTSGAIFYEIACGDGPGFMLETRADGTARGIDCLQASNLGGGCTMTNLDSALAARTQAYVTTLKSLGQDCVDAKARVVGTQRAGRVEREAAEIKCSNQPLGLLLLNPTVPGEGKAEFTDCIGAGRFSVTCELTGKDALLQALTAAIRAVPRNCDVADFRYMSLSADGDIIEVACAAADQNAYVLDLPPSRARPLRTIACASWLERGGERCSLPGNAGK